MKQYIKKFGPRVAFALAVVVLLAVLGTALLSGRAGPMQNLSGGISAPVGQAASAAIRWLENLYGYVYKYDQLVAENNSLRAQLAQAQQQAINASEYQEENERLRELLNFAQKNTDFVFEPAKVTEWSSSNWSSSFTISKGSANSTTEMEVGDCVVTEYGALVGQIIEIGDTWSTVRTIVDASIDVGALVGEAEAVGMCIGDFALMQEGHLKLTYLAESAQLLEDDVVLTSGKGTYIPQGLIIGYIESVLSEASGQTLYGVVDPAADLDTLTQVFIITDFRIQE